MKFQNARSSAIETALIFSTSICRRLTLAILFLSCSFALPVHAQTNTVYLSQGGGTFSGGSACNGHTAVAYTSVKWSSGSTYYVCGTLTGAANSTVLNVGASNVTILFDTGAIIQAPHCSINGCIYASGVSNLTINGQNTGIVQSTLNGTSGGTCPGGSCSYQQATHNIFLTSCANCTVENLSIINAYVRTSNTDETAGQIALEIKNNGSSGAQNAHITGNTVHDCGNCIYYGYGVGDGGLVIANNTVANGNWLIAAADYDGGDTLSSASISGNDLCCTSSWDDNDGSYNFHHNYVALFAGNGPSAISGMAVYNNYEHGDMGNGTSFNYADANSTGGISVTYYNNLIVAGAGTASAGGNDGAFTCQPESGTGTVACHIYNNTIIGVGNMNGFWFQETPTNFDVRNNIIEGWGYLEYLDATTTPVTQNFNDWFNGAGGDWKINTSIYTTLASFQAASGRLDANSVLADPNLSASYVPNSGSPAIGLGTNLAALCSGNIAALCLDKAGNARPGSGSGNWDAGAFQSGSVASQPAPPSGLTASIN